MFYVSVLLVCCFIDAVQMWSSAETFPMSYCLSVCHSWCCWHRAAAVCLYLFSDVMFFCRLYSNLLLHSVRTVVVKFIRRYVCVDVHNVHNISSVIITCYYTLCLKKTHKLCNGTTQILTSKFALFSVSSLKVEKLILKKQTYTETEAYKLYSGVFWIFVPHVIKIGPFNFELYRFKVCAFFWDTV